jgi:hypothetical protein
MENLQLKIQSTLPAIRTNFEEIKNQLEKKLSVYDFLVQEEDVKLAKENIKLINSLKKELETMRKDKVQELSVPINDFNSKVKDLVAICDNSSSKLLSQVKVYEDEQKKEILLRLNQELSNMYQKFGVVDGFKTVKVDDLAILSNGTKTGISKKTVDEIESRVVSIVEFQRVIEKRVLSLSSICFEKGLEVPLAVENVKSFLYEKDENSYNNQLNVLIDSEKARLLAYKTKVQEQIQKPKELDIPIKTVTKTTQTNSTTEIKKTVTADGKVKFTVVATFEIECDEKFEPLLADNLKSRFEKAIDKNGKKLFSTVPNVEIIKHIADGLKQGSLF